MNKDNLIYEELNTQDKERVDTMISYLLKSYGYVNVSMLSQKALDIIKDALTNKDEDSQQLFELAYYSVVMQPLEDFDQNRYPKTFIEYQEDEIFSQLAIESL